MVGSSLTRHRSNEIEGIERTLFSCQVKCFATFPFTRRDFMSAKLKSADIGWSGTIYEVYACLVFKRDGTVLQHFNLTD